MINVDWKYSGLWRVCDTAESWRRDVLLACMYDTKEFARYFLNETFHGDMTHQHDEIWSLMDDDSQPRVAVCGWRGIGKSSSMHAKLVKSILLRQQKFVMCVGNNYDFASQYTEDIKAELTGNERILEFFGSVGAQEYKGMQVTFGKKAWFACDPKTGEPMCFVLPRGARQSVRGASIRINGRKQRPTFIGVDDLETDEDVENEDTRVKTWNWFDNALCKCVSWARPNATTRRWPMMLDRDPLWIPPWRIFYLDTYKHDDATMARLMGHPSWRYVRLPLAEYRKDEQDGSDKLYSLVPEIRSHEQVRQEHTDADRSGNTDGFCRENLCLPGDPKNAQWTKEMFEAEGFHFHDRMENLNARDVFRAIIVDPAQTANAKSDFHSILGFAADLRNPMVYLRDQVVRRLEVDDGANLALDMALSLNTKIIAVEIIGAKGSLKQVYKDAAAKRRLFDIQFIWLEDAVTPRGDFGKGRDAIKRARAAMALPYYRTRTIKHEWTFKNGPLETTLLSYPNCKHWDAPDTMGYVPIVMEKMEAFFDPVVTKETKIEQFDDAVDYARFGRLVGAGAWRTL